MVVVDVQLGEAISVENKIEDRRETVAAKELLFYKLHTPSALQQSGVASSV